MLGTTELNDTNRGRKLELRGDMGFTCSTMLSGEVGGGEVV